MQKWPHEGLLEPYVDIFGRAPIRFVVRTKKQQGRTNRSLTFDIINIQTAAEQPNAFHNALKLFDMFCFVVQMPGNE